MSIVIVGLAPGPSPPPLSTAVAAVVVEAPSVSFETVPCMRNLAHSSFLFTDCLSVRV